MLNFKRTFIFGMLLLFTAVVTKAQESKVDAAYGFLMQKQLDSAKVAIDAAIVHPETSNDLRTWYVRAFIYKSIFNEREKTNYDSPARLESLKSFKKMHSLATTPEEKQQSINGIKYLTTTIYNGVADNLDTVHYKTAISMFELFKEYYPLVDSSKANIQKKDVEFLLALASTYTEKFKNNKSKNEFLTLTKNAYNKVLAIDPNNVSANYNMGLLFYNQAVDLINQSDYDLDIVALSDIQDNSITLFKESLPFMEKAYSFDPKRKETLLGLSGIYFSLNDFEKSELFKQKLKEIEQKK
jgi:tetratricopeptide (TPR) repeat protein